MLAGKIIMPPFSKQVDVMLVGFKTSRCDVGGQNNHAAILTSIQMSRCDVGRTQNK
jgi:hypothetical protein